MRFWDSSALVPLVVVEQQTPAVDALYVSDPAIAAWWATRVECHSALVRLMRDGTLAGGDMAASRRDLEGLLVSIVEVPPEDEIRPVAEHLLAVHPLRAADALQLAAALAWAGDRPLGHELVSLDARLRVAALTEGFSVLPAV